jgi:hypothetical protein
MRIDREYPESYLSVRDLQQRDLLLLRLQLVHGGPRYDIAKELRAKIK